MVVTVPEVVLSTPQSSQLNPWFSITIGEMVPVYIKNAIGERPVNLFVDDPVIHEYTDTQTGEGHASGR